MRPLALASIAFVLMSIAVPAFEAMPAIAATAPRLPNTPLHTEVTVEVNKKGQVVRITSTKPCKVGSFNVQTFGNALQMWIRRPDGTAQIGLYRVTYDYDPKTQNVARHISLVKAGGGWADAPGAANVMMENVRKEAAEQQRRAQEQNAKLPSLNEIRGVTPSPKPTLRPM
jgi:hypothetical protein